MHSRGLQALVVRVSSASPHRGKEHLLELILWQSVLRMLQAVALLDILGGAAQGLLGVDGAPLCHAWPDRVLVSRQVRAQPGRRISADVSAGACEGVHASCCMPGQHAPC